jgi:hypothetical protein
MQFPNRQVANGTTSSVQEDMFEIQLEERICDCKIDAERVIVRVCQAKVADHNRTQKRCIDLIDVNSEALLSRPPPNPPTDTMGHGKWRKPDRQQRSEEEKQTNENKSIF